MVSLTRQPIRTHERSRAHTIIPAQSPIGQQRPGHNARAHNQRGHDQQDDIASNQIWRIIGRVDVVGVDTWWWWASRRYAQYLSIHGGEESMKSELSDGEIEVYKGGRGTSEAMTRE